MIVVRKRRGRGAPRNGRFQMLQYRLRVGLDVDDILYDCNAYALERLCAEEHIAPPLTIYDIEGWGSSGGKADRRVRYFSDPDFVAGQPLLPGAVEFVRELCRRTEVFFISAVPPSCMSARAERLCRDFPWVPEENILLGTRKDMVQPDILLDDGAHNIVRSPAAYPVLFRKPWNTHLSGLLSVNTYEDFLHLVDMICRAFAETAPDLTGGGVLCLVGPTGSGKNAVARELERIGAAQKPLTATTRPVRAGESDTDYRFLTRKRFIAEAEAGHFLETTVYGGHYFGTGAREIDEIVNAGRVAVIPIDICGALTLKNRYRERAMLLFLDRSRAAVIREIILREMDPEDKTCRILSLDAEYRNERLCDFTVDANAPIPAVVQQILRLPSFTQSMQEP